LQKGGFPVGVIVIVGYKPKPGKADALRALMRTHVPRLRDEGLATARMPILMEAKDGTVIEVFEWVSAEAINSAHTNPQVLAMWGEYEEVCEYAPVGTVAESSELFSGFVPLD
jgi:quinol monooxygenase YgiN